MNKKNLILSFILILPFLFGCENTTPTTCPEFEYPEKFFPIIGSSLTSLDASKIVISNDFEIAPSSKQVNPFTDYGEVICNKGEKAGRNINYLYCNQLKLQKFITNEEGDIIQEKIIGVQFVFDQDNYLIETNCFK